MSRSLRNDRPSLSVGRYVVTDPQRVGRYVATNPQRLGRYVATDPQRVGCYVATDLQRVGRYVATNPRTTRSLRSDRTVSDIDQWEGKGSNRPWREYIRSPRQEAQRENFFRENLALRAFRQLFIFVISSCDSTRFCSLRLLELGISPTSLMAEASTLL
ncbi:hypothetical protein F2Q69_00022748 [Brassica cretica]|uniref:Uncharacterized protein n=1 Tax=Brassica cretica TaxID=69181 RepID=A0A8S9Q7X8_BRACR|nr:hypothetical protein F2Q69_00022748 [Brassica cretica]